MRIEQETHYHYYCAINFSYRQLAATRVNITVEKIRSDFRPRLSKEFSVRPDSNQSTALKPAVQDIRTTKVQCSPVQQFLFTKSAKTGSSTMYVMLARYVMRNHLNVFTIKKGVLISWDKPNGKKLI